MAATSPTFLQTMPGLGTFTSAGRTSRSWPLAVWFSRSVPSRFVSLFSILPLPLTCSSTAPLSKLRAPRSSISRPQSRHSSPRSAVGLTILLPRLWHILQSSTVPLLFPTGLLRMALAAVQDGLALRPSVFANWLLLGRRTLSIWLVFGYSSCWMNW